MGDVTPQPLSVKIMSVRTTHLRVEGIEPTTAPPAGEDNDHYPIRAGLPYTHLGGLGRRLRRGLTPPQSRSLVLGYRTVIIIYLAQKRGGLLIRVSSLAKGIISKLRTGMTMYSKKGVVVANAEHAMFFLLLVGV